MRNEQVDVFERQTVVLQQFGADGGKAAHSLLEDFTPLHLEVKIVLNRIAGLVVAVRPAADGKQGILPPVRTAPDIPEAGGRGQAPFVSTAAAAPSPNRMQVVRSSQFRRRVKASEPTSRTLAPGFPARMLFATSRP